MRILLDDDEEEPNASPFKSSSSKSLRIGPPKQPLLSNLQSLATPIKGKMENTEIQETVLN